MSRSVKPARRRAQAARIARERERRRSRRLLAAWTSIGSALGLVAVLVLVRVAMPSAAAPVADSGLVSPAVAAALIASPSILDSAGRGRITSVPVRLTAQPPLLEGGKPVVLYVGAEYCPFCAAQRWGLVVALSRFGSFASLRVAQSGLDDVYPGTATVSFHGATYTSPYLSFAGVELAGSVRSGETYAPLDALTAAQTALLRTYNAPPYVSAESAGAVPFVDFGNRFLMSGSAFSPSLLSGLRHDQIAAEIGDPMSPVGQAVLGSANAFTAVLCELTNGDPAAVCTSAAASAFGEVAHARG